MQAASLPKAAIVTVNWNATEQTMLCLDSLFQLDYPFFEVFVVDNGSWVNPEKEIMNRFPKVRFIRLGENSGFTGGNNTAMCKILDEKQAEFIWLVNNDATVSPDSLKHLTAMMQSDPKLGMISPVVWDTLNDEHSYYGSKIHLETLKLTDAVSFDEFLCKADSPKITNCLWGTALFLRANAVSEIGLFDDSFFAYYEDTDYSLRFHEHGWKVSICPSAVVNHLNQKPELSDHFFYFMVRNEFLLISKYSPRGWELRNKRRWFARNLRRAANRAARSANSSSDAILDGMWHALIHRYGPMEGKKGMPGWIRHVWLWHPYLIARLVKTT